MTKFSAVRGLYIIYSPRMRRTLVQALAGLYAPYTDIYRNVVRAIFEGYIHQYSPLGGL